MNRIDFSIKKIHCYDENYNDFLKNVVVGKYLNTSTTETAFTTRSFI